MARGLFAKTYIGLDGFGKTLSEVQVKTRTGAFLTMISAAIILVFALIEVIDYRTPAIDADLRVNTGRSESMSVKMNITFPRVPCYLLSLDITDISGDTRQDVSHNVLKTRLDATGEVMHENTLNYRVKSEGECCQTCESVRQAYLTKGWSFDDATTIEQCVAEHWTNYIHEQSSEGCRIKRQFHFSPGRSFLTHQGLAYDLVPYLKDGHHHDFGHYIHEFHFEGEREVEDEWRGGNRGTAWRKKVGLERHPLEGVYAHVAEHRYDEDNKAKASNWMFHYFMKVVSTEYKHLDGDVVRAYQYSVTSHERDIRPHHDYDPLRNANGIKMTHGYEGLPGATFQFDVSPMMVAHTERSKSFAHFATSLCAIIGGVLTLGAIVDSVAFAAVNKIEESGHD
ncbi:endoplasmic reticulum vesicle transporter-domain-containing protein [Rhizoctonia solani]|nr:endoplasmic reticulum vesicle transporter-domain-containing protein [Rhizoctonia solani]